MITFNDLKSQVYDIAQQRFGHLTDDIKQRLDVELAAIEKYDNSAVIACIWRLFDELYKNNICSQLRIFNEYGVSLVCYVLGISMFNPLDHPTLDAESIALKAFRYCPWFNFSIDGNAYKLIEQWLKENHLIVWLPFDNDITAWCKFPKANKEMCDMAHKYGEVGVWILHEEADRQAAEAMGADIIETTGSLKP